MNAAVRIHPIKNVIKWKRKGRGKKECTNNILHGCGLVFVNPRQRCIGGCFGGTGAIRRCCWSRSSTSCCWLGLNNRLGFNSFGRFLQLLLLDRRRRGIVVCFHLDVRFGRSLLLATLGSLWSRRAHCLPGRSSCDHVEKIILADNRHVEIFCLGWEEQIKEHNPLAIMTALRGYFLVCFKR